MKNYFFLLAYLCTSFAFSQSENDKKVFLDSLFKETTEENHKYYRIIKDYALDKTSYKMEEYYKSGVKKTEGLINNKISLEKEGEFITYYENGNKESSKFFSQYKLTGKEILWYENGNKKSEATYTGEKWDTGRSYKIDQFWDIQNKQTVINGNGFCNQNTQFETYSGNIKDGLKDGVWTGKYFKSAGSYSETYKEGQFISGVFTDSSQITHEYTALETPPEPQKGIQDFYNYLGKNIQIPRKAKNITGKILIEFIIDKDGKIVEPKIVRSLNPELDKEAVDVLMRYENWIPGQQRGRKIRCRYTLPLSFKPAD
jgi:TonB family protein